LRFTPEATGQGDGAKGSGGGGLAGALSFRPPRRGARGEKTATTGKATGRQTIYVQGTDGKPQPIQVVTGETNGTMTEVLSGGLKPGMAVITGQLSEETRKGG